MTVALNLRQSLWQSWRDSILYSAIVHDTVQPKVQRSMRANQRSVEKYVDADVQGTPEGLGQVPSRSFVRVPQSSTGFSPFEVLYGRRVRGPLDVLKEIWSNEETSTEVKNTYAYIADLRNRLEETCQIVRESLLEAQGKYKHHYDRKPLHSRSESLFAIVDST